MPTTACSATGLFARANNIFDKYYETIDNYATAGANVFVGVRYAPK
jgi:vitamin B12 transporter